MDDLAPEPVIEIFLSPSEEEPLVFTERRFAKYSKKASSVLAKVLLEVFGKAHVKAIAKVLANVFAKVFVWELKNAHAGQTKAESTMTFYLAAFYSLHLVATASYHLMALGIRDQVRFASVIIRFDRYVLIGGYLLLSVALETG